MTRSKPSLFARHDTFFGVCEALGQDFGFNANWLRLAVAVSLLVFPLSAVAASVGLGLVVLASRLAFPDRAAKAIAPEAVELESDNDAERLDLAQAA